LNVLSLFDGISCGRVALDRAGINVDKYYASEIDDDPIKVSLKNYPDIVQVGNVTALNGENFENIDLLFGGSPCTYWSVANHKNRETTTEGLGYILFKHYVRVLKETNPKYFLYENNYSIHKNIKEQITEELGVEPIVIDSRLVSGQQRKRCYWTNIPNVTQPEDRGIKFHDIVKKDRDWFDILPWSLKEWGGKRKLDTLRTIEAEKSFCLTTNKSHPKNYYLNEDKTMMTKLDAEEAEILQTLPVGYTDCIPEGKRFKAIGNGWTVDVIAHILKGIKG
jgi:site-specific DNA-cytosine methylase